jgi:hypothetical protein
MWEFEIDFRIFSTSHPLSKFFSKLFEKNISFGMGSEVGANLEVLKYK